MCRVCQGGLTTPRIVLIRGKRHVHFGPGARGGSRERGWVGGVGGCGGGGVGGCGVSGAGSLWLVAPAPGIVGRLLSVVCRLRDGVCRGWCCALSGAGLLWLVAQFPAPLGSLGVCCVSSAGRRPPGSGPVSFARCPVPGARCPVRRGAWLGEVTVCVSCLGLDAGPARTPYRAGPVFTPALLPSPTPPSRTPRPRPS